MGQLLVIQRTEEFKTKLFFVNLCQKINNNNNNEKRLQNNIEMVRQKIRNAPFEETKKTLISFLIGRDTLAALPT